MCTNPHSTAIWKAGNRSNRLNLIRSVVHQTNKLGHWIFGRLNWSMQCFRKMNLNVLICSNYEFRRRAEDEWWIHANEKRKSHIVILLLKIKFHFTFDQKNVCHLPFGKVSFFTFYILQIWADPENLILVIKTHYQRINEEKWER